MFGFALVAVLATATTTTASPVGRVVTLLTELKAKVVADGSAEQAMYDRYACWCEETTARKAAAIEEAKDSIEQLSKDIQNLGAAGGVSTATIDKLNKDIAENEESQKSAEALRNKEHNTYVARKAELEENVRNVQTAITTLSAGTTGFTPAMFETESLTVAAGVRKALHLYEHDQQASPFKEDAKGKEREAAVKDFLRNPAAWVQVQSGAGAPHLGKYTTQSTVIQGMLAEMKDTFERELAANKEEEDTKQDDYDDLMTTKQSEHTLLKSQLTARTTQSGSDVKSLAENKVEREETEAQLAADSDFFASMKQGCKDRADQWAARSHTRTDELGQIAKAIEILEGGADTFETSDTTFVQLHAERKRTERGPRDWAFSALKKAAKHGRVRLALLATEVYEGLGDKGHFDLVLGEIDTMIKVLRDEEKSDIEKRDYCQATKSANDGKKERLEYDMTELDNKISRLENKISEKDAAIAATNTALLDLNQTMADATQQRNESNLAWRQADIDDRNATQIIQQTIDTLQEFYAKEALVATTKKVVKKDVKKEVKKAKEEPEYDADGEPEMWTSDYEGQQSAGGGIISILEMIKEDTQKEMALAAAEEAAAQKEFEDLRAESWQSKLAMDAKKAELKSVNADLKATKAHTEQVKSDKDDTHTDTVDYLGDLATECAFINTNFDTRASQRKDEVQGLENAKNILNGAGYDATVDAPTASGLELPSRKVAVRPHKETVEEQLADLDADERQYTVQGFLQRR